MYNYKLIPPLNLTTLKLTSKGRAVLGDSEMQNPWWCGGAHLSDMGRPTYGSARVTPTAGILRGPEIQ